MDLIENEGEPEGYRQEYVYKLINTPLELDEDMDDNIVE